MSANLEVTTRPAPPRPAALEGTPEERYAAIHDGMSAALDEVISRHPHIVYALGTETPEIRAANQGLAAAVNSFVTGGLTLRKEVRPHFERAVAEYLKVADHIVLVLRATIVWALDRACGDHPYLDFSLENERINETAARFSAERDLMLRGRLDTESLCRAFYELVAAYADAATPGDLPVEPVEGDA